MKRIGLVVLLVLFSVSILFAGGDKESTTTKKTIRVAEQVPGLITPGLWDGQAFSMNSSIYEYLVEIDTESGELVPVLAKSWETDDGTNWTFHLQQGVSFHDGSEFTSEDVKFTIERTLDSSLGHLKQPDFEIVDSVEVVDKYTITLHLKEARPTFIYQFTDYNMAILSHSYDYENLGESMPMGTGPFKMVQLIPKESALLEKNSTYWVEGLPKVDQIAIYFIADIDASVSMLEDERVDIVPFVTPQIKNKLDNLQGVEVISPYQEQRFVAMRVDEAPFDDNNVRLAFKYSIDPHIIARSVSQMEIEEGAYYNETPIMNMLAEYKETPLRERDIEKAKELLAEAGYPNGVKVDLYYASDHPFGKELSQTLKELSAPAGFDLNLKGYTRDIYLSQYWLNVPMSITGWGGRIDPSMLLALAFKTGGSWNETHMSDPYVDDLIDKISNEIDDDKRMSYYGDLQDYFYENGALLNVQVPYLVAINENVVNYKQPLTMIPQYKYMDIK
jgi:peptide/nickel transport system substrate-binding protein